MTEGAVIHQLIPGAFHISFCQIKIKQFFRKRIEQYKTDQKKRGQRGQQHFFCRNHPVVMQRHNVADQGKRKQGLEQIKDRRRQHRCQTEISTSRRNIIIAEQFRCHIQNSKDCKEKEYLIIQIICSFLPKKIPQDQQQYYHCRNQKIHIVNHGYPPSVVLSFHRMND